MVNKGPACWGNGVGTTDGRQWGPKGLCLGSIWWGTGHPATPGPESAGCLSAIYSIISPGCLCPKPPAPQTAACFSPFPRDVACSWGSRVPSPRVYDTLFSSPPLPHCQSWPHHHCPKMASPRESEYWGSCPSSTAAHRETSGSVSHCGEVRAC